MVVWVLSVLPEQFEMSQLEMDQSAVGCEGIGPNAGSQVAGEHLSSWTSLARLRVHPPHLGHRRAGAGADSYPYFTVSGSRGVSGITLKTP